MLHLDHQALAAFTILVLVGVVFNNLRTSFHSLGPHSSTPRHLGGHQAIVSESKYIVPDLSLLKNCLGPSCFASNPQYSFSESTLNRTYVQQGPGAVLVLALDASQSRVRLSALLKQRMEYCKRHGFGLFACFIQELDNLRVATSGGDRAGDSAMVHATFAPVRILLHAMRFTFPGTSAFWLYESSGHIRDIDAEPLILDTPKLSTEMLSNLTQPHVELSNFAQRPENADVVLAFDHNTGLISSKSIAVRNSISAVAFLQMALDPLLRSWQPYHTTADHAGTALTHILRWHPSFVRAVALVPSEPGGILECSEACENTRFCLHPRRPLLTDDRLLSGSDTVEM